MTRPILCSDLAAAARALLLFPAEQREALCQELLTQADWADRYVRRLGRWHPIWGNGTLLAAARQHKLAKEPTFNDPEYCRCIELVLGHLRARRVSVV